jgi:tetratricopeptide (TPR) repeat protein
MDGGGMASVRDVHADQGTTVVAFYSYADGAGRSCMVANIALILAGYGHRVLVVDHDHESPSLHRYLSAFMPATPGDQPIRLECDFIDHRGSVDFAGPAAGTPGLPDGFTLERGDLTERGYDFVLIDTASGDESVGPTRELADILVLGYTLNKQFMEKAAEHAQAVLSTGRRDAIRVLPVPMKVDQNAGGLTARMRVEGRRLFAWLLTGMSEDQRQRYWDAIEIPYEPDYAIEESLPFLDDLSDQRDRLVAAYHRLAALLAPGADLAAQAEVTDQARLRYLTARHTAVGGNAAVTVLYAAADRLWAEWLAEELRRMDVPAARKRIDRVDAADLGSDSVLVVVSGNLLADPARDRYLSVLADARSQGGKAQLGVSADGYRLPSGQFPALGYVTLAGKSAGEARAELASYYRVPGSAPSAPSRLYYPGRPKKPLSNAPSRVGACHGRDDVIDRIRDHFTSRSGDAPLVITGPAGVGKSRLALEYAHRFGDDYDLVFLIRAYSVQAIRAGLADLSALTRPARPGGDAGLAALRELSAEPAEGMRWLLIYDGADTVAALEDLVPEPGHGHVLVTARAAPDGPARLTLPPLSPPDADAMLAELVPEIRPAEARQLAIALDGIPLALGLAAGWIRVVTGHLLSSGTSPAAAADSVAQELRARLAGTAADGASADPDPVNAIVDLLIEVLTSDERGAAASLLLQTCAFLAPIGMSRRLLRSPGMLTQLSQADAELADPAVLHNVVRALATHGFSLRRQTPLAPLEVHPRVMEILRDRLTPDERAERMTAVTKMLAASAPLDMDDDVIGHAEIYAELLHHAEPSGALNQTDDDVRRWLVNQVRYLWQAETVSAWQSAADLGGRLARHWAATLPDKEDDALLLRLRTQLANVHRSLGEFDRAREIDGDVLRRQRRVLGVRHLRSLMTARSYGADLRLAGDFEGALLEDQSTWQAFSLTLGEDHLMTLTASGNLALSELMNGDPEQALERQERDLAHSQRMTSERPWQEAWILRRIGILLRELGRYKESLDRLRMARDGFDDLTAGGVLMPAGRTALRTAADLAITGRRLGKPDHEATKRALDECRHTYGELDPNIPALSLSLAGDLHAGNRHEDAVSQAESARQTCLSVFGSEHPFTRLCEVDLSSYALAAGQTRMADRMSEMGFSALERALGHRHLWSLAAAVARANTLVAVGRLEDGRSLEERTLAEYRRRMGPGHPFTRAVGINAAHTRLLANEPGTAAGTEEGSKRRQAIELDIPTY